jgi:hypothetical protein
MVFQSNDFGKKKLLENLFQANNKVLIAKNDEKSLIN